MTNHKKVIEFPKRSPLKIWDFYDFGYWGSANNPIQTWYDTEISSRAQLAFESLLKNNEKIESPLNWSGVEKQMQGKLKGHQVWQWVIRGEVQYRILGSFNGQKRAVFLMGYHHKGDIYTPSNALDTALERKKLLDQGRCKLYERQAKDDL